MRRTLLIMVSLFLILSLSAGSTALADPDAVREAPHAQHDGAQDDTPACGQAAHTDLDECNKKSCVSGSHCMSGAMPLAASLDLSAVSKAPNSPAENRPAVPCTLEERPPRAI
jgi:hypothetical protein